MAALNTGWCARITATDTRDIYSVWVNFSVVSAAGVITLRAETIDATAGKPSGTLYDANASKTFTPVAGWQQVTFSTPPSTGRTVGAEYGIVLLTTTGGTTMTLRSTVNSPAYPIAALTAADGTTRSNFAEVASGVPVLTIGFSDGVEEPAGCCPFGVANAGYNIFGTQAAAGKILVPAGETMTFGSYDFPLVRTGTPAGDLRLRVLDSTDAVVSGSTVTIDKDSLAGVNAKVCQPPFPGPLTLSAGTYRIVFDSASSANSSNCWRVYGATARIAANVPAGNIASLTTDVTAVPIVWTDTATDQLSVGLRLETIPDANPVVVPVAQSVLMRGRSGVSSY